MRYIPSTLVVAALFLIGASWPSVQAWSDLGTVQHYLVHALYLLSGGLVGLQTAWWVSRPSMAQLDEGGVSS